MFITKLIRGLSAVSSPLKKWLQCVWWKIKQKDQPLKSCWNIPASNTQSHLSLLWNHYLLICLLFGHVWNLFRLAIFVCFFIEIIITFSRCWLRWCMTGQGCCTARFKKNGHCWWGSYINGDKHLVLTLLPKYLT